MLSFCKSLIAAFFVLLATTDPSWSYRVTPLTMNMDLGKGHTTKRMTVTNPDAVDKAVVVAAYLTTVTEDGKREMAEVEAENVLIFPPQALVKPGASQTFIIQWLGDPDPAISETYTVAFRQIPVSDEPAGGAALRIMVNVLTTLSIQPHGADAPTIQRTVSATARPTAASDSIEMTVHNSGTHHAYVSDADITLAAGGWSERMDANDVLIEIGEGLVPPQSSRRFVLPIAPPAGAGSISASFAFADRGFRGRQ